MTHGADKTFCILQIDVLVGPVVVGVGPHDSDGDDDGTVVHLL